MKLDDIKIGEQYAVGTARREWPYFCDTVKVAALPETKWVKYKSRGFATYSIAPSPSDLVPALLGHAYYRPTVRGGKRMVLVESASGGPDEGVNHYLVTPQQVLSTEAEMVEALERARAEDLARRERQTVDLQRTKALTERLKPLLNDEYITTNGLEGKISLTCDQVETLLDLIESP